MPAAVASRWQDRRRRVFQSVFQTDLSPPTPQAVPLPSANLSFSQGLQYHSGTGPTVTSGSFYDEDTQDTTQPAFFNPPDQGLLVSHTPSNSFHSTVTAGSQPSQLFFAAPDTGTGDQAAYDNAWRLVTARITLPSSVTSPTLAGSLPPDAALPSNAEFCDALAHIVHASTLLPGAIRTDDVFAWHTHQVRAHFSQHVIPLLSGCLDTGSTGDGDPERKGSDQERAKNSHYERHMVIVMSSIRTLEAALRLYSHGFDLLVKGITHAESAAAFGTPAVNVEVLANHFRRDIHALVGNSISQQLTKSLRIVLVRLVGNVLGIPSEDDDGARNLKSRRPAPPTDDDFKALAARQRLHELVEQLHNVGLAGERFQVLFAEVMDWMMSAFVCGAYAGVWSATDRRSLSSVLNTVSRGTGSSVTSPCIISLMDWVENHFARLSFEVLSRISHASVSPVTLSDLKTYQSLALSRLSTLRIAELFDIVLAWPDSRGALDDLRATITTSARRLQLTSHFTQALKTRLLHPGCSTLEILQTYIDIIHTFHALDHSKVLLGHVEPSLKLYLWQREDAVRIVVTGLLASPDEVRAARKVKEISKQQAEQKKAGKRPEASTRRGANKGPVVTPTTTGRSSRTPNATRQRDGLDESSSKAHGATPIKSRASGTGKLVELALLLNDPTKTRHTLVEDEELDWNDMNWVPDPVDAGANYKRPKSEDVIGTLISALGSEDVFIKEFASIVAERLLSLSDPARFDQELRVLDLLKRRFGEAALQNCDVMIKDIEDSRRLDVAIRRAWDEQRRLTAATPVMMSGHFLRSADKRKKAALQRQQQQEPTQYHARILSRLFWPALDREHFLLPDPIIEEQKRYEQGYEHLKSNRKLTWLNQLGTVRVELELRDRTVTIDCTTPQATVIYAFNDSDDDDDIEIDNNASKPPGARRTVDELYTTLQMDEDLITSCLEYWVSKKVLRRLRSPSSPQGGSYTYVVIESLSDPIVDEEDHPTKDDDDPFGNHPTSTTSPQEAGQAAEGPEEESNKPAIDPKELERRTMYWQYIKGMLTNASASMPLAQMAMMMKMLIADGFPWTNEELGEFLAEKIAEGEMEVVSGGKYRLVKK
ncbi:Cullin family-domain-containing protein [Neurospora tetraspora]|uniref:Anaphase-promoting complex subunit 2 n=1 Tax=Neurospora tetraspora TaxID=94610 RepID=A0AAE0MWX6_9PEZI|nr:Cullin family-domain-containing protein [Neurospora tetraspora]